jgi:hypothetical protein
MTRWNTEGSGGAFIKTDNNGFPWFYDSNKAIQFTNRFLLPFAGEIDFGTTLPPGQIFYQSYNGFYWSSSPDKENAHFMYLYTSNMYTDHSGPRAFAQSVRCFKD